MIAMDEKAANEWIEMELDLPDKEKLHVRPMQMILEEAQKFQADIRFVLSNHNEEFDPKSMHQGIIFAAEFVRSEGTKFRLKASGSDAAKALESISDFILSSRPFEESPTKEQEQA